MNIVEMHIRAKHQFQRVNAYATKWFEPEEIDLALNTSMYRYIINKFTPLNRRFQGFEQSSKRIEDLRALVVPDYVQTAYKLYSDFSVQVPIPGDHLFTTRVRPEVNYISCEDKVTTSDQDQTFHYVVLDFPFTYESGNIESFDIEIATSGSGTETLSSDTPSSLPNDASDYTFPDEADAFLREVTDEVNKIPLISDSGYKTLNTVNAGSGKVVIEVPSDTSSVTVSYGQNSKVFDPQSKTLTTVTSSDSDLVTEYSPYGVFSNSNKIDYLLEDPHNTTTEENPLFTIREGFIDVYYDESFFVTKVKMDYVRWPKPMSYNLNQDCELAEHTHDEIVSGAVAYMMGSIGDERYQFAMAEKEKAE